MLKQHSVSLLLVAIAAFRGRLRVSYRDRQRLLSLCLPVSFVASQRAIVGDDSGLCIRILFSRSLKDGFDIDFLHFLADFLVND